MGIPWDGMGHALTAMEWDGTEKYVPWTSLGYGLCFITKITLQKEIYIFFISKRETA